jgi:hypothetical protein
MSNTKVVKCGTHGYFDVFTGNGWKNWVRIRMVKGNTLLIPIRYNIPDTLKQEVISLIQQGKTKFTNFKLENKDYD